MCEWLGVPSSVSVPSTVTAAPPPRPDHTLLPGTTIHSDKGRRAGKVIAKQGRAGLGLVRLESR